MPLVLGTTVCNASLTATALALWAGETLAWPWLGMVLAVTLVRALLWLGLRRRAGPAGLRLLTIGGSACAGVVWGGLCLLTFPAPETYQLFVAFVAAGMCAGAISAYGAHFPTAAAFVIPVSLALALRFALERQPIWLLLVVMVFLFAAGLLRIAWNSHRSFGALFALQVALAGRTAALAAAEARLRAEIDEHQATEAALRHVQKMEAIGQLASGIAHDFNNMLAAIGGNLQLIEAEAGDAPVQRYVEAAERAADRGAKLVASLLGFVRPSGAAAGAVQVNALVQDFLPLLRRAAGACRLQTCLAADLPDCAVEAAQFQSVVLNLVINARDASPGGGTVTLRTELVVAEPAELSPGAAARPGRLVAISVADTGTGMTEEVRARAFEPFFTTKPPGKGSGLGLAQVLSFARLAGGHATVESAPGEGTVVTVFLPEAEGAAAG